MIELAVNLCSEDAILPTASSEHSAGFNLYSAEDKRIHNGTKVHIDTGIKIKIPNGFYGRIIECSNMTGPTVASTIIDTEYKDTIKVVLLFFDRQSFLFHIKKGQVLAQLILEKIQIVKVKQVSAS